ncbi:MAG TPA: 50S ribosomal protein L10 [Gaiellaceae bacterium]|jgi:large subunit ribosomal protein L10|nr:50S ribosomal protein L10 [Gaiellaceae bacterium]
MKKEDKELVVAELTERLRTSETLLVADYRGLTMPQIDALRTRLLESGARFSVVKNTLGRRAAEAAGSEALLTLLEGPSAIAFLAAEGDMVAAAKALADMARESKILMIKGGVLQGRTMTAEEVESLATLPPLDILRGQVLAAIIAPVTALLGLVTAPLQNLYGLIDARIEQLEAGGDTSASAAPAEAAPVVEETAPAEEAAPAEEPAADAETTEAPADEAPEPAATEETTTEDHEEAQ